MLDLKLIRSDPERVKAALARRGAAEQVDELLALDARRRELLPEIEGAQAERKTALQADRRGQAGGRGRRAEADRRRCRALKETDRVRQGGAGARSRPSSTRLVVCACPTCPTPTRPTG